MRVLRVPCRPNCFACCKGYTPDLGVDDDGFIVAATLTENHEDDSSKLPELIGQVDSPIQCVTGDGAEGTWAQRNAILETIRETGRQGCQRESRYRLQGTIENLPFRYKRTLGNSLRACGYESQIREAMIGIVLNRMAELGW